MKKTLVLAASLAGALGVYAQGTVNFGEVPGSVLVHVYGPSGAGSGPNGEVVGNGAGDSPAGSATYTGAAIGGNATATGSAGYGNGNNFTAELYGLGTGTTTATSFSQLQALTQYSSTFSTRATGAGTFLPSSFSGTDPGIPQSANGTAVLSLAAWYNGGGTFATLGAAESAGVPYGWSPLFTLTGLGNLGSPPSTPPNLTGLQSFSLVGAPTGTPEPGTIALGIMGAAAFLARRRSK